MKPAIKAGFTLSAEAAKAYMRQLLMFPIRAEHIYVLRNSTGKPFTDLMDRLIRSSTDIVGVPPSAIRENPRTNLADGGVDTEVTQASARDHWNYFTIPSAWQFKSMTTTSLSDRDLDEEIGGKSKTYVRELIQKGYGYRIFLTRSLASSRELCPPTLYGRRGWWLR